jgi:quinol monooxygenase YgiN
LTQIGRQAAPTKDFSSTIQYHRGFHSTSFLPDRFVLLTGFVFMVSAQRTNAFLEVDIMNTTIAMTKQVITLINILTVEPENQQKLIELLRGNTKNVVSRLDGWISTSFIAAKDQRHVVIYSQWRDLASVEAMRANPDMVAYFPRIAALAAFDGFAGDVVYNHHG